MPNASIMLALGQASDKRWQPVETGDNDPQDSGSLLKNSDTFFSNLLGYG